MEPESVICPGGGYQHLAHRLGEGQPTSPGGSIPSALPASCAEVSITPAVWAYLQADIHQVQDKIHVALEDAESAMRSTPANASKWNLKPNAIGMMIFGGRASRRDDGMVAPTDVRPDFLVLGYPAIPAGLAVTASTPCTFLVAADDDPWLVNPADNAGRFSAALRAAKVPAELHVYSSWRPRIRNPETGKDFYRMARGACRLLKGSAARLD